MIGLSMYVSFFYNSLALKCACFLLFTGMVASLTPLPVIGVPVRASVMDGLDSLLSIVQVYDLKWYGHTFMRPFDFSDMHISMHD